ncbi:MAG: NAD regulator [Parvularculaceae bacterium]
MGTSSNIQIGLNGVLASIGGVADDVDAEAPATPNVLCVRSDEGLSSLPYGPFDPARHRTFEIGLRDWVERQTRVRLGFVEQLYTFGDKGREAPAASIVGGAPDGRVVSVGYLALAADPALDATGPTSPAASAAWRDWYAFFPWEDWRHGEPRLLAEAVLPGLAAWADRAPQGESSGRRDRIALAFGFAKNGWEEERALDRYELMYEAGLVEEAWRDRDRAGLAPPRSDRAVSTITGATMASDHRRILATAVGRLRGKLKYRAIIFELLPTRFTLLALQRAVEAIVGYDLHKQNFRRAVEASGLVDKTEETARRASGRPAALFTASDAAYADRAARGLAIPRLRRAPNYAWR